MPVVKASDIAFARLQAPDLDVAEKFLRKNPKKITFYAPIVTWLMTVLAGTGHTSFSTLPVIVEVETVDELREALRALDVDALHLSLTHDGGIASAVCIAEG